MGDVLSSSNRILLGLALLLVGGCQQGLPVRLASEYHAAAIEKGAVRERTDYSDPVLVDLRTILLTTEINESSSREIISKLLFLDRLSHQPINLYLSTYGGFIKDAFSIIDVVETLDSPVNTIGMGACYSGGALLLAAGTGTRSVMPNTTIVLHSPTPEGKANTLLSEMWLKINRDFLSRRTRLPAGKLPTQPDRRLVLSLPDALEFGLIDTIINPHNLPSNNAHADL